MKYLIDYDWPGNVRELENAIERAVVLTKSKTISLDDINFLKPSSSNSLISKNASLKDMEREHIKKILEDNNWNISNAANILGVSRSTLHRMIKRHHLRK